MAGHPKNPKIKSVIELAKYKAGQTLYWVVFRPVGTSDVQIPPGDEWLLDAHPKVIYDRGLASKAWHRRGRLPRLCSIDFQYVTEILTSEPVVEAFVVADVVRSHNTGEFYYANDCGDWMPEPSLFRSAALARREKMRVKTMFAAWAARASEDEV